MFDEKRPAGPMWLIVSTGVISLVAGVFVVATKYQELRRARAEAIRAEKAVAEPATSSESPSPRANPVHPEPIPAGIGEAPIPATGQAVDVPLSPTVRMSFRRVPGGTARLGSPAGEAGRELGEAEHEFSTPGFWLGKYEVTRADWNAVMSPRTPTPPHESRLPVTDVSWQDVRQFLDAVNNRPQASRAFGGVGQFRIPTEDEWEYACRGGKGNASPFYFGGVLNGVQANSNGSQPYGTPVKGPNLGRPVPVGTYAAAAPHPWGLCDMHGNVYEYCEAVRAVPISFHVLKGGSFGDSVGCRSANRNIFGPETNRFGNVGFRLCFRTP